MSLGALTNIFTPNPTCLFSNNRWRIKTKAPDGDQDYDLFGGPSTAACLPPDYNPAFTAYYSPGRCPSGYTVATDTTSAASITETVQICCPTEMAFSAALRTTSNTEFPHMNTLLCGSEYQEDATVTVTSSNPGDIPFVTEIAVTKSNGAIHAYGIIVKFQASDSDSKTTTPEPEGTGNSPGPTTSSVNTTPPGSSESGGAGGGGGLGTGASVGIGVSVGLLGLAAIIGGVYFLLRSRKRRLSGQSGLEAYRDQDLPEWKPAGAAVHGHDPAPPPQELHSTAYVAPGSTYAPLELDAR